MKDIKFVNIFKNEFIKIRNYVNGDGEIEITGDIGESFFNYGYTFEQFKYDLSQIQGRIIINLASYGGDLLEAWAIYDHIRTLNNEVVTKVVKASASAATIIALAGDKRLITKNSKYLIHKPMIGVMGNSDDFEQALKQLKDFDKSIIEMYVSRTKLSSEEVLQLMMEERWMTAEEAIEKGFCDGFVEEKSNTNIKNDNNMKKESINTVENKAVKDDVVENQVQPIVNEKDDVVENQVQPIVNEKDKDEENPKNENEDEDKDKLIEDLKAEIKSLKDKLNEIEKEEEDKKAKNKIKNACVEKSLSNEKSDELFKLYQDSGMEVLNKVLSLIPKPQIIEKEISNSIDEKPTFNSKLELINAWKEGKIDSIQYTNMIKNFK